MNKGEGEGVVAGRGEDATGGDAAEKASHAIDLGTRRRRVLTAILRSAQPWKALAIGEPAEETRNLMHTQGGSKPSKRSMPLPNRVMHHSVNPRRFRRCPSGKPYIC
jgi:hypothetical protein